MKTSEVVEATERVKKGWGKNEKLWWAISWLTVVMIILIAFAGKGYAAEEDEKAGPVFTVASQLLSKYVDDNGAKYTSGAVLQSSALANLPLGVWFEAWNSKSLRISERNELDLTLGMTKEIFGIEVEVGVAYVNLERLMKSNQGDLWKGYASMKRGFKIADSQTMAPFVRIQGYLPVRGSSADEKGFNATLGIEHGVDMTKGVNFSQKTSFLYDDGALGFDRAVIFGYEAGLEAKICGPASLTISGRITTPISAVNDGRKTEIIPAVGVKFNF